MGLALSCTNEFVRHTHTHTRAHTHTHTHAHTHTHIPQENIELAKKDWELSHLQSLREEEERLAEEEADDVLLTYDRPEMANKVILRRRPSTGTWEVCSPSPAHAPPTSPTTSNDKSRRNERTLPMHLKHMHKHQQDSHSDSNRVVSPPVGPRYLSSSKSVNFDSQPVTPPPASPQLRVSPRLVHAQSDMARHQSRSKPISKHHSPKSEDPDYTPELSRQTSSGGTIDVDYKLQSPVRNENEELATLLSSKEAASPSASLDNSVGDDDSISSRTRHRASQVAIAQLELEKSPNHKYPTRLKLAGHS